jgi:hypothetical protein
VRELFDERRAGCGGPEYASAAAGGSSGDTSASASASGGASGRSAGRGAVFHATVVGDGRFYAGALSRDAGERRRGCTCRTRHSTAATSAAAGGHAEAGPADRVGDDAIA